MAYIWSKKVQKKKKNIGKQAVPSKPLNLDGAYINYLSECPILIDLYSAKIR